MCTLTLAWRAFEEAPVVVAANRDEALDRPSEPPSAVDDDPSFVAPRDAEAGGTWEGYNDRGVYVGVTNRWVDVAGGGERSRGLLVRDALRCASAEEARATVESAVEAHAYDAFNLVVADADAAYLFEWDGDLRTTALDPGVHVVVNVGVAGGAGGDDGRFFEPEARPEAGRRQAANARAVRSALEPDPAESAGEWVDRARAVLGDHEYGVCVHDPEGRFGTVSSSVIALFAAGGGADADADAGTAAGAGADAAYLFAPGPPCETAYRRVESQV